LAKNSSFIFLSVGFSRWQKINVLFVRLAFSVRFYFFSHYAQRVCVWLVALGTKIAKGDESEGNSENFPIGR
jgi:hypothetical protein